jgi:hypothetical protein
VAADMTRGERRRPRPPLEASVVPSRRGYTHNTTQHRGRAYWLGLAASRVTSAGAPVAHVTQRVDLTPRGGRRLWLWT